MVVRAARLDPPQHFIRRDEFHTRTFAQSEDGKVTVKRPTECMKVESEIANRSCEDAPVLYVCF